jgi:hypothetical protein
MKKKNRRKKTPSVLRTSPPLWGEDPPLTPPSMEGDAIRQALPIEGEVPVRAERVCFFLIYNGYL